MIVTKITDKNFVEETAKKVPIIIDFNANWCAPCNMLDPIFARVSDEFPADIIRFGKLSAADFPDLTEKHKIEGIPCMIIFKEGKEVGRIVGFFQRTKLKEKITEALKKIN